METKQVKEKIAEVEKMVKDTENTVENKVENVKNIVSDNLSNIAEKVHEKIDASQAFLDKKTTEAGKYINKTVEKANDLGHRAGETLKDGSEYIKNFDVEKARESVKVAIKEKPEIILVAVGLFGLLIGYLVGRKTSS